MRPPWWSVKEVPQDGFCMQSNTQPAGGIEMSSATQHTQQGREQESGSQTTGGSPGSGSRKLLGAAAAVVLAAAALFAVVSNGRGSTAATCARRAHGLAPLLSRCGQPRQLAAQTSRSSSGAVAVI